MNTKPLIKFEEEPYFPEESYGLCIRKNCKNRKGGDYSELANGYCVMCWDRGWGFKKGHTQYGYRYKEYYAT